MARVYSGKRPQNLKRTLGAVSRYLGGTGSSSRW